MRHRYHYSFGQKAMFLSLWLVASLLVVINFYSNPLLSIHGEAPMLSMTLVSVQSVTLITLWCLFSKASCSMAGMLRWLGIGIIILPYIVQLGLLSYLTF